jgi:hypothetical protein
MSMLLRGGILPIALGLLLSPAAWAGDDDKKSEGKKGNEMTIRGVVSEVTLLGETDVDFKTGKAMRSEATFLTIIGHPQGDGMHKEGTVTAGQQDKAVKQAANSSAKSGEKPKHRMNVYVVAVTPKTKFCECSDAGKDGSASKEEACELEKLEIGDRVEVCFDREMADKADDGDKAKDKDKDDAEGSNSAMKKHGRHRTYFGIATSVKIMEESMEGHESDSKEKSEKK